MIGSAIQRSGAFASPRHFVPAGLRQVSRNLYLRTHPDNELTTPTSAFKIMLVSADEIVMDDGTRITDWGQRLADITASGAAGLDTGSEANSTWYEVWAIGKAADGTGSRVAVTNDKIMLHRFRDLFTDSAQSFTTAIDTTRSLRLLASTASDKLAQGFQSVTASSQGPIDYIDAQLIRTGAVTGSIWFTIEGDSGGSANGTPVATTDKFDAAKISTATSILRFGFRTPFTPVISTQYHLVLQGDYAKSDTIVIGWRGVAAGGYANGSAKQYNGSVWSAATGVGDFYFKVYTRLHDSAPTMPSGYDLKAKIGYAYNNSSGNFEAFTAKDNKVKPLLSKTTAVASGTFTNPGLTDLSAFVPAQLCRALFIGKDTGAAASMKISELSSGYDAISTGSAGFASGVGYVTTQGAEGGVPMQPVMVISQAIYSAGSAGGAIFLMEWEW